MCVNSPRWVITLGDGVKKVLCEVIWILATYCDRFILSEIMNALIGLQVNLNVFEGPILPNTVRKSQLLSRQTYGLGKLVSVNTEDISISV